ncbi:MAG TPA: tetratricopeptide repeat protein, partial [Gemmatimonadaceae bacterium]
VGIELVRRRLRLGITARRLTVATIAATLALATFQRGLIFADQETLYRDVIDKAPGNARGYLGVGLAQFARDPRNPGDAELMFRKAIAADTMSFVSWQSLGVLQLTQARWQDAVYTFTRSLRIEPGNLDAIGGMARAYVELQDANNAMRYVDQLGGRNIPALWAIGNLLVRQGRGPEALRYLEVAAASEKPSSLGVALMSLAYAQSGSVPQAERAAQVATSAAGDTADVYNLAARAMIAAKRPAAAREYLVLALALDPNSETLRKALENLDSLQARRHAQ